MLNQITIMGRLVADPELETLQSGVEVCNFRLAVDRDYKNGDEKVADFFTVTCWRGTAKFVSQYFKKGRMVIVLGSMESRKYTDKEGKEKTVWEVQGRNVYFGDSKKDSNSSTYSDNASHKPAETFAEEVEDDGGELPF